MRWEASTALDGRRGDAQRPREFRTGICGTIFPKTDFLAGYWGNALVSFPALSCMLTSIFIVLIDS